MGGPDDLLDLDVNSARLLDLGVAHPNGMAGFLAGRPTQLSTLFRSEDALRVGRERARALALAARRLEDVYGLSGVFLATGVFRFDDPVLGRVTAPIVLRPLTLAPLGAGADVDFDVHPGQAARLNPALVALLAEQGIRLANDEVSGDDHAVVARQLIDRLAPVARHLDGTVSDKNLIGTFTDAGPAMIASLRELGPQIEEHRTVRALLHRPSVVARHATGPAEVEEQAALPGLTWQVSDRPVSRGRGVPPARAWLLDPAQLAVLQSVLAGGDLRVEAAPGAGVTTVAAAAVEALAAEGRTVLVVAPGQDELADLVTALRTDASATAEAIQASERSHRQLHHVDSTWGVSMMQLLNRLTELGAAPDEIDAAVLSTATLRTLSEGRGDASALLREAEQADGFTPIAVSSPWAGAALADSAEAQAALGWVQQLLDVDLPEARTQLAKLAHDVGLPVGLSLTEWTAHIEVLTSVRGTLDLMLPQVYDDVTEEMVVACASSNWRASQGVAMSMLDRRRWRREATALVRPGVQAADLHASLSRARLEKDLWQRLGGSGEPQITPQLADAVSAYERVADAIERLEPVLAPTPAGGQLSDLGVDELGARLRTLAATGSDLRRLPERAQALARLDTLGLTPLVHQLRADAAAGPLDVDRALEIAWLRGVCGELGQIPAPPTTIPAVGVLDKLPGALAAQLTMTTGLALGRVAAPARYDVVLLLDAHRLGLSESVLAIGRGSQVVLVGDPTGGTPPGLDLEPSPENGRTSLFTASAGLIETLTLDRVHRQPTALAELTHRLSGAGAVQPAWSVASAAGHELSFVHVPGSTVPADDGGDSIPGQEVEGVVAQIAEHVRATPAQSLAVLTATKAMAVDVADALRRAVRRSPELAEWLSAATSEPLAVTDLKHAGEVSRDHVIVALGLAHDPFDRFSYRFGPLDAEAGAALLGAAVGRARQRLTVVSSLWATDIDPALVSTEGGRRALSLLSLASGEPDPWAGEDHLDSAEATETRSAPVLGRVAAELREPSVLGVRHDREPDLALRPGGASIAVLWDGFADAGPRRPLADALTRFGWTVHRVSAAEAAQAPVEVAAAVRRSS